MGLSVKAANVFHVMGKLLRRFRGLAGKRFSISQLVLFALSVLTVLVLAWVYFDRIASYEASQRVLAMSNSKEVANQISFILKERQRQVQLFAEDNQSQLRHLLGNTSDEGLHKAMESVIKRTFPDYFAFTIADQDGQSLMEDFDGFVGDICVRDIQEFARSHKYATRIHPNNFHYHYDVIAQWSDEAGKPYFLMVSFEPTEIGQMLKAIEQPGHQLLLITHESPAMIEITTQGSRDKTPRDDYRLSTQELSRILSRQPVSLSGWDVADMQQQGFFDGYRKQTLLNLAIFLLIFVLVIAVSFFLLRREERLRLAVEAERELLVAEVSKLAFYDSLTQLPNRYLLDDRLLQALAAGKRSQVYGAMMFLDLDNFKPLNDAHGHVVGDLLLVDVGKRLKSCVRDSDTVARFGGDEFVVLLGNLSADQAQSQAQAASIAEKIRASLAAPYLLNIKHDDGACSVVEHRCTVSIGVALFLGKNATPENVLVWADSAMYQAKAAGRNLIRFYTQPS